MAEKLRFLQAHICCYSEDDDGSNFSVWMREQLNVVVHDEDDDENYEASVLILLPAEVGDDDADDELII